VDFLRCRMPSPYFLERCALIELLLFGPSKTTESGKTLAGAFPSTPRSSTHEQAYPAESSTQEQYAQVTLLDLQRHDEDRQQDQPNQDQRNR
jgi:Sec-independent protein translocase protein TatA